MSERHDPGTVDPAAQRSSRMPGGRFDRALLRARSLHDGQIRKGSGAAFVAHLLAVAALVLEHGGDEETAIAALLHDAAEDRGGATVLEAIGNEFGRRVADLVAACSDTLESPKPDWRPRKSAHLAAMAAKPGAACLIIGADALHNLRSLVADRHRLGEALWERFQGGRDGTLWYYGALIERLDGRIPAELAWLLRRALDQVACAEREDGR